jgi:hypothetical protein
MLPTLQTDVWIRSTEDDWRKALATFERQPSRATSSAEFDQQVYFLALDGTTRYGLAEAVKAIVQGALGHAFFPSPPELRMQCDKAMQWHEYERERIWQRERNRLSAPQQIPQTPEGRERVAKAYDEFCAGYVSEATKAEEAERQFIRDKYGMTPERLASIPDRPAPRMGEKAA